MLFTWFKIFNLADFQETGLVSRTYTLNLEGVGERNILVTQGDLVSITYDDVMLSIELNGMNPFYFEGYAVWVDVETDDVFLGIEVDEG